MLIHHAPEILAKEPEAGARASAVAARTYELTQFLVDVLGVTDVGAIAGGRVTYHACCHGLRGLGVKQQPQQLLEGVKGVERCTLEESEVCCGFGGLFAVKMSDISSAMLGRKLDCIEATTADTVIVTDVSCAMHMNGGLHRRGSRTRVKHLAELLAGTTK
jgi:L-lactate dehydrogenase complex protein LldE